VEIELKGVTKRFGDVVANREVDLTVAPGEIVGLLGENGAGKSTLMNVLYGLYAPTEGEIVLDGEPTTFAGPADAIAAGIGMVHQHFMLVPVFTVTENVMLGVEPTGRGGVLQRRRARRRLTELSDGYGLEVHPDAVVENLSVGEQQRVEILKALYRDVDCLILDEPTAVLTPGETEELFAIMRTLADDGRSMIFISHKLGEMLEITDRIVVLRGGERVGETTPDEADEDSLASMMVGRDVQLTVDKQPAEPGDAVLEIADLVVHDDRDHAAVDHIDLTVHSGEIVAVAGVQGNGQSELVEALTGLREPESGAIRLCGDDIAHATPRMLFGRGVAHVPEDRLRMGVIESFSVADNLMLNTFTRAPLSRGIVLDRTEIQRRAERLSSEFDVRAPSLDAPVSALSGGNQQKLVVAREFSHAGTLLVASQPTRGVDVGSIEFIHSEIVAQRDEGAAVLIVSSELDEVLALADRIAVLYRGQIVALHERADTDREQIGLAMAGADSEEDA
jgi:ABC-type uncharacterized transport system ATPase subunit